MVVENLTSDRVKAISFREVDDFYNMELLNVHTDRGMLLIVDKKRYGDLKIGDQIDIHLDRVNK